MPNGRDRMHDRHRIPAPSATPITRPSGVVETGTGPYVDGIKERIHDLFRTLGGLDNHVVQVQQEFNRLSNSALSAEEKLLVAHQAYDQLVKAAQFAGFDFPMQTFTVQSIGWSMQVGRQSGRAVQWKTS
ncbi:MAG: hypothetical protein KGL59_07560 [Acidobacteriota bacterium]|nr:hypothetical protein [Acidobacteriota bacterium]